jgi:hypothetical protein
VAGLLRAVSRTIDTTVWAWLGTMNGQRLFYPPSVAGWEDDRWLDTSTLRGRWHTVFYILLKQSIPTSSTPPYDPTETAATAVTRAMAALGNPSLSTATQQVIAEFAATALPSPMGSWQKSPYRAMRQNALRMLIANSPDLHVS